jgi:hypothetical protein
MSSEAQRLGEQIKTQVAAFAFVSAREGVDCYAMQSLLRSEFLRDVDRLVALATPPTAPQALTEERLAELLECERQMQILHKLAELSDEMQRKTDQLLSGHLDDVDPELLELAQKALGISAAGINKKGG